MRRAISSLRSLPAINAADRAAVCMNRISQLNKEINAIIALESQEKVGQEARDADERRKKGVAKSPIDGMTVAIKDNFCTKDFETSCASAMLREFKSPFDATAVTLLKRAGAIIVGKTNMDEFGMGSANVHSEFGPVFNPRSSSFESGSGARVAGGSSGGSAAAVASGMCYGALGSDTGGSVRLPASFCGVVGFKPSYGRVSRWGLISYANSLDTVGILTSSVEESEKLYEIISAYDKKDPTSMPVELREDIKKTEPKYIPRSDAYDLTGLRVGVPQEYFVSELAGPIRQIWAEGVQRLQNQGASIHPVSCPNTRFALSAYYVLAPAEASSNLARYDGVRYGHRSESEMNESSEPQSSLYATTRQQGFGAEVRRRILLGTYVLTSGAFEGYFLQAQRIRKRVQEDFNRVFRISNPLQASPSGGSEEGVDVLLTPTAISTAPLMRDCVSGDVDILDAYVNDVMTVPASLAGIPAMSVPFGKSPEDGLPVGLQLLAQYGQEPTLFHVAKVLQSIKA
ncbi:uncharacterized protein VTP21DRAFT_2993 [Calcarisporiella thermophila]|uniref:uncharacterized protein n=1 Tax=Calcarisporiella thermophila TaxID=911321 RepID=UPI00374244EA